MMKTNSEIKALYIHIPFCKHICTYCDFPKLQYFSKFITPYLNALEGELKQRNIYKDVETIYVGGGTPTSLSINELEMLLKIIAPYSNKVKEYTFEANPETLEDNKLLLLKKYKVNRLSIGVESTNDNMLQTLNRHHSFNDVQNIVSKARKIGISNINLDLMIGLPNATFDLLKRDLDNILSLNPNHISVYSLTIHEHTAMYNLGFREEKDDVIREYYDYIHETLERAGFIHYELSNFALKGYESKHNITYWKDENYYGIGLGASGYIGNIRYTNTRSINDYINNVKELEKEIISLDDDKEYFVMLNLRTRFGINLKSYEEKFGEDFYKKHKDYIDECVNEGLLEHKDGIVKPTYSGMMVLDTIVLNLI